MPLARNDARAEDVPGEAFGVLVGTGDQVSFSGHGDYRQAKFGISPGQPDRGGTIMAPSAAAARIRDGHRVVAICNSAILPGIAHRATGGEDAAHEPACQRWAGADQTPAIWWLRRFERLLGITSLPTKLLIANERCGSWQAMLIELRQAHTELLGFISELEAILAADEVDASGVARVRLQLSKASSRRRRLVAEAIRRLSKNARVEDIRRLNLLRENDAAILAASSSHVGDWSIEAILADSEGYRIASSAMRKSMRERIATEKAVLYPLLERVNWHQG